MYKLVIRRQWLLLVVCAFVCLVGIIFLPARDPERVVKVSLILILFGEFIAASAIAVLCYPNASPGQLIKIAASFGAATMLFGAVGNCFSPVTQLLPGTYLEISLVQLALMNVAGIIALIVYRMEADSEYAGMFARSAVLRSKTRNTGTFIAIPPEEALGPSTSSTGLFPVSDEGTSSPQSIATQTISPDLVSPGATATPVSLSNGVAPVVAKEELDLSSRSSQTLKKAPSNSYSKLQAQGKNAQTFAKLQALSASKHAPSDSKAGDSQTLKTVLDRLDGQATRVSAKNQVEAPSGLGQTISTPANTSKDSVANSESNLPTPVQPPVNKSFNMGFSKNYGGISSKKEAAENSLTANNSANQAAEKYPGLDDIGLKPSVESMDSAQSVLENTSAAGSQALSKSPILAGPQDAVKHMNAQSPEAPAKNPFAAKIPVNQTVAKNPFASNTSVDPNAGQLAKNLVAAVTAANPAQTKESTAANPAFAQNLVDSVATNAMDNSALVKESVGTHTSPLARDSAVSIPATNPAPLANSPSVTGQANQSLVRNLVGGSTAVNPVLAKNPASSSPAVNPSSFAKPPIGRVTGGGQAAPKNPFAPSTASKPDVSKSTAPLEAKNEGLKTDAVDTAVDQVKAGSEQRAPLFKGGADAPIDEAFAVLVSPEAQREVQSNSFQKFAGSADSEPGAANIPEAGTMPVETNTPAVGILSSQSPVTGFQQPMVEKSQDLPSTAPNPLFGEGVNSEIDALFSNLAPPEAQKEVVEIQERLRKASNTVRYEDPPSIAPKKVASEIPAKQSGLLGENVNSEIDQIFANLVSADAQQEVADRQVNVAAKENADVPNAQSFPELQEASSLTEEEGSPILNPVTQNREVREFGRLSAKSAAPELEVASVGTMKTIGKLLIDVQMVENIIKSGESGKLGRNLSTARVISEERGQGIKILLEAIDECEEVTGSLIVGHDGLVIASTLDADTDKDTIGALSTALLSTTNLATLKLEIGKLSQMVLFTNYNDVSYVTICNDVEVGILVVLSNFTTLERLDELLLQINSTVQD